MSTRALVVLLFIVIGCKAQVRQLGVAAEVIITAKTDGDPVTAIVEEEGLDLQTLAK